MALPDDDWGGTVGGRSDGGAPIELEEAIVFDEAVPFVIGGLGIELL